MSAATAQGHRWGGSSTEDTDDWPGSHRSYDIWHVRRRQRDHLLEDLSARRRARLETRAGPRLRAIGLDSRTLSIGADPLLLAIALGVRKRRT